jgi:hypothetical protein
MNSLTLSAKINETQIAQVNLPANELVVYKNLLPAALYNDGTIHLKIFGNNAVSAIIALYEYEPERGGCSGGPQSAATLQMEKVLFDGIYPNPFTGDINLTFTLPYTQQVAIKLYDVTGRVMRNVCSREMRKGLNELLLETKEFAAGVYFVRIETDTEILTEKVIMVR